MTTSDEIELAIRRAAHPNMCPDCGTERAPDGRLMALAVGLCAKHWKNPHPSYAAECAERRAKLLAQIGMPNIRIKEETAAQWNKRMPNAGGEA